MSIVCGDESGASKKNPCPSEYRDREGNHFRFFALRMMMMTIAITATIAINGSAAVRNTTQSCRNDTKAFQPVDNAPRMR